MILTLEYSRVRRLASVPTIMYHGTDRKNLPIILSQGLIPNPKKRAWHADEDSSFNVPSRASLPGIYLTTNLSTATSSGGSGNNGKCLVVAMIQSGSLLADEDDFKYRLNQNVSSHEYTVASLYAIDQAIKNNLIEDESERDRLVPYVNEAKVNFVKTCLQEIGSRIKGGLKPQEEQVLTSVLAQGFHITLARKAAYLGYYLKDYDERLYHVLPPDKVEAEQNFKQLEDRLTRVLKRMGRPEHLEQKFSPVARIETPISYSGKNKIIAVVEILPYNFEGEDKGTPVVVRYPRSGEVPDQLVKDYTERQGDWYEAVARGKRLETGV